MKTRVRERGMKTRESKREKKSVRERGRERKVVTDKHFSVDG